MAVERKQLGLGLVAGVIIGGATLGTFAVSAQDTDDAGDKKGNRAFGHFRGGDKGQLISEALGVSIDDLKAAKQSGQSIEDLATENGFESLEALHEAVDTLIAERLAEKGLSQEEIDEKLARIAEHREFKGDMKEVFESVLGLSRDEAKDLKESGQSFEDILADKGFADKDAFHDAIKTALSDLWVSEGADQETIDQRLERFDERGERREHRKEHHKPFGDRFDQDSDE